MTSSIINRLVFSSHSVRIRHITTSVHVLTRSAAEQLA